MSSFWEGFEKRAEYAMDTPYVYGGVKPKLKEDSKEVVRHAGRGALAAALPLAAARYLTSSGTGKERLLKALSSGATAGGIGGLVSGGMAAGQIKERNKYGM